MSDKPTVTVVLNEGRCTCGCGGETKRGRRWRPGHDQRMKGQLQRAHGTGARVTVVQGKQRRQVSAHEAASLLDTDRHSWSGALTPQITDEAPEDVTGGQE